MIHAEGARRDPEILAWQGHRHYSFQEDMARNLESPLPPQGKDGRLRGWFSERLRHWRNERGLTQEELGWAAETSTRHLSFLESGRSRPSEEMVLRLLSVLDVPLSERNQILAAEGHPVRYPQTESVPTPAETALRLMLDSCPFPMAVLTASAQVVRFNRPAQWLFQTFAADPTLTQESFDMVSLVLDPRMARPFLLNFEEVALRVLTRLHLGSLERPRDPLRRKLLERALSFPDMESLWSRLDKGHPFEPLTFLCLERDRLRVSFRTVLTALAEPLQPAITDLAIETYYPADPSTQRQLQQG